MMNSFQNRLTTTVRFTNKTRFMKHILIATDFSPSSQWAVDYGIHLAAAIGATATVIAAYEEIPIPVADTMSMTFIETTAARDIVEEGLHRLHDRFQQEQLPPIRTLAVKGPAVASILNTAAELKAEMIVAGMKGKGKSVRKLLGSTVTALARKTTVPLLVVPDHAKFIRPANILFGNDIRPDTDIHVIDPLRQLVSAFHSTLYVLRILQKGAGEFVEVVRNQAPLRALDSTWDVKYEYQLGDDVVAALGKFAEAHNIQLVVMIPHPHSLPERWFMGTHTREMLFAASTPLLLLPEHT